MVGANSNKCFAGWAGGSTLSLQRVPAERRERHRVRKPRPDLGG